MTFCTLVLNQNTLYISVQSNTRFFGGWGKERLKCSGQDNASEKIMCIDIIYRMHVEAGVHLQVSEALRVEESSCLSLANSF